MTKSFEQAVVVITGGASGIGASLSMRLAADGAKVIIVGRSSDNGAAHLLRMKKKGLDATFKVTDMTDTVKVEQLFNDIVFEHGKIDYVFNNAGVFMAGEIRDTPIDKWQATVNNNIWAVYNGTHFAYQHMLKQGSGYIINVASAAGLFPVPIMGIYGSSKFAIVGLTHALRNEAKDFGITVSAVCPTIVDTPLYDTATYNKVNKAKVLKSRHSLQTPDEAAAKIIKGVLKNKQTIHTSVSTQIGWWAYKLVPSIYNIFARKVVRGYRTKIRVNTK